MSVPMIGCSGGCGLAVLAEDIEKSGWSYLQITGRYRCGTCERLLYAASTQPGTWPREGDSTDPLPPNSIGALKKLPEAPPLHEKVRP